MARATGVGGVFFRATDPTSLSRWYMDVLGLPASEQSHIVLPYAGGETLTWSVFPYDTDYFGPSGQASMINYRVDDLDGVLDRLRAAGAVVDERIEEHEYGRFGWAIRKATVSSYGNRQKATSPADPSPEIVDEGMESVGGGLYHTNVCSIAQMGNFGS